MLEFHQLYSMASSNHQEYIAFVALFPFKTRN